jgi:steroid 5-alpha reductase family enzyme
MNAIYLALAVTLLVGVAGWLISLKKDDVSIVDSLWSLMFLAAAVVYFGLGESGVRAQWLMILVTVWALRLSIHITVRSWGHGEDHRYQTIRRRNEPNFRVKSLYLVFLLQGALAWFISLPLYVALSGDAPLGWIDAVAAVVWLTGMLFESVSDYQLSRFTRNPDNKGKVLDRGFWRYSRHPNYFGEACVWWGYYLFAVAAGGWWTFPAPVLMTFLLLKVSGVALLEKDISNRRPAYAAYVARTPAFIPGPPRTEGHSA